MTRCMITGRLPPASYCALLRTCAKRRKQVMTRRSTSATPRFAQALWISADRSSGTVNHAGNYDVLLRYRIDQHILAYRQLAGAPNPPWPSHARMRVQCFRGRHLSIGDADGRLLVVAGQIREGAGNVIQRQRRPAYTHLFGPRRPRILMRSKNTCASAWETERLVSS